MHQECTTNHQSSKQLHYDRTGECFKKIFKNGGMEKGREIQNEKKILGRRLFFCGGPLVVETTGQLPSLNAHP